MTTTYAYDGLRPMFFIAVSKMMNQSTSKERDAEAGLDYFGGRYDSGTEEKYLRPNPLVWVRQRS